MQSIKITVSFVSSINLLETVRNLKKYIYIGKFLVIYSIILGTLYGSILYFRKYL